MKKQQLEILNDIAKSKGGRVLSSVYISSHTHIQVLDEEGNTFSILPYALKQGKWSPHTAQKRKAESLKKYTIQDLKDFAKSKNGQCISDSYIKTKTKYDWIDSKGRPFSMSWESVLAGQWSPHEKRETLSKLRTIYTIKHLQDFAAQFGAECLSKEYTSCEDKYTWKDRNGKVFQRTWQEVKKRNELLATMRSSHESQIDDFVRSLGFETFTDRTILEGKELDIYIPERNLAIEMNGIYWHTEKQGKNNTYHYNKFKGCNDKNIDLIQIYDIEWESRSSQIKSFLMAKLGKNKTIGARHTEVRIVDKKIARTFLNDYHIQGSCAFDKAYGLYYGEELLSLVTIGKHHRGGDIPVLSRFVGRTGVSVVGGLSKLVKATLNDYNHLVTWVDLRYSNGDNWLKSGWKLEQRLAPDYRYYDPNTNSFISKQSRKKKTVNTPEGMTELEHALQDGLTRIYDAGKIRLSISK